MRGFFSIAGKPSALSVQTGSELRECKTWLPPHWKPLELQECWWAVSTFCRALSYEAVATHSLCCEPWRRQLKDNWPRETERVGEQLLGQYTFLCWSHPLLPLLWVRWWRWQLLGGSACPKSGLLQVFFGDDMQPWYLLPSLCPARSFKSVTWCWLCTGEGRDS